MIKVFLISLILISFIYPNNLLDWSNNFDTVSTVHSQLFSGFGNHLSGFKEPNSISNDPSFYEVGIHITWDFNKQNGFDLRFGSVSNKEVLPSNNYNTQVKYAILSLFLNGEYFGFNFGVNYHEQERPYFNEEIDNGVNIGPVFRFKIGIINRVYLDVSVLDDSNYIGVVGLRYHFDDYFSQIWISRIKDGNIIGFQVLVSENITILSQGLLYEFRNYKSLRVGLGYIF